MKRRLKKRIPAKQEVTEKPLYLWRNDFAQWAIAWFFAVLMGTVLPTTHLAAATIEGIVFTDNNCDGRQDAGEAVWANETIYILQNSGVYFTADTEADGSYSFDGHSADSFDIWGIIPEGWKQSAPAKGEGFVLHRFQLAADETKKIDFGFCKPLSNQNSTAQPCADDVVTVRSKTPFSFWNRKTTWNTGKVPGPDDWVLIKTGHKIILPADRLNTPNKKEDEIKVKGLCIEEGAVLQSNFNKYAEPPSWVNLAMATLHNKGTIQGFYAASTSGDCKNDKNCNEPNNWLKYKHAEGGSHVKIVAYKVVNDGTIQAGTGGTDSPWKLMDDPYFRGERNFPITGGKGGSVEILAAIIINNKLIQSGNGGDGDSKGIRSIHGPTYGGKGGDITALSTLLEKSTNAGTLKAGCGGSAEIPQSHAKGNIAWVSNDKPSSPGKGGDVSVNVANMPGQIKGCTGGDSIVNWDSPTLKATSTTRIEGFNGVRIFGGEDWTMELGELSEGAISAESITIAVGEGGKVDLSGVNPKAFKATKKFEIFANEITADGTQLNKKEVSAKLSSVSVAISPSKILYHVDISSDDYIVGEPGAILRVKITLLNGGPMEDTYSINVTDSAGWQLGNLPATVTVNSMLRRDFAFNVTLPEVRGKEDIITLTATSRGDPDEKAVKAIRVGVKAQEAIAGKVFRDRLKDGSSGPEMVWIPEGRFQMGDIQGGGYSNEKPVHWVSVNKFAMGRYEITFAEYDKFATATGREKPSDQGWGRGNRPVINVSLLDVTAYAEWLSQQTGKHYRLPTEAQWEYAARADTSSKYWWGNDVGKNRAACDGCGAKWGWDAKQMTAPKGSFAANPFGLYDTAGNVWEWTCSEYESRYNGKELKCLGNNNANDGSLFVLRGGSWGDGALRMRSSIRNRRRRTDRSMFFGVRLARIL